jgi:hypothetical protein
MESKQLVSKARSGPEIIPFIAVALSAFLLNFPEVPSVEVCAFPFAWLCPIHA